MAGLILKTPYYKPRSKTDGGGTRSGYVKYIATREGAELLPRSGMAGYIGERKGSNGLFSDLGAEINLSAICNEIDSYAGNVWGLIFSLTRVDAERLGYNSAKQWMNLLRSRRNDIAKEMGISPGNLRWYAAYHNKEDHPHVHMLVWSKNPTEAYLSAVGIHNIKSAVAGDIFRQDLISVYKEQTEVREGIKKKFREKMSEIVRSLRENPSEISPEFYQKFSELCGKLSKTNGKKVYGYLGESTKKLVNEVVKMFAESREIAELYDLWYKCQCETYRTYTDVMPEKVPIEQNETFRSLRNRVVKAAAEVSSLSEFPTENSSYYDNGKYAELGESELRSRAEFDGDRDAMFRYGRKIFTEDPDEGEYYLQRAAQEGQVYAMFFLYRMYKNGTLRGDAMKYLLMAVEKNFGGAEYEYALYLKDKSKELSMDYLIKAARHGSYQAEYQIGKMLLENGKKDEALVYLKRSAEKSHWARTKLGLLYYYQLGDREKGWEYISEEAMRYHYKPAEKAWEAIQNGLDAQIIFGICDLLYYAGNIIDERTEQDSGQEQYTDRRLKQQDRAKRQGIVMNM